MMRFISFLLIMLCFLSAGSIANADWTVRNNVELSPQYRKLNQKGASRYEDLEDVFGLFSTHLEWSRDDWFAEAKPEIRAVASQGVFESAPAGVSAQPSRRLFNSRRTLVSNPGGEAYFDFDRLNIRRRHAYGDMYFGRRPVSLGVLKYFPVWNKLTLPLIFQPGPEWIENPDVIGGSLQFGRWTYRLFASRAGEPSVDDLALLETRFAGEGLELQALTGSWWLRTAAGLAGAFDVLSSTFRFEALWISAHESAGTREEAQGQFGLGIERALDAKWTATIESLYQTAGLADTANTLAPPSRFMILSGRAYLLPNISYQVHPLWLLRLGVLANLAAHASYVALGGFDHSLSDNTTLTLKVKWPFGATDGEFGPERINVPLGRKLGMSSTILMQLQMTF